MSAQHTPGPWGYITQTDWPHRQDVYITGKGFGAVARVSLDPSLPIVDEQRANLRLIAAAPELLIAARAVAFSNGFDAALPDKFQALRAAIAKATGSDT